LLDRYRRTVPIEDRDDAGLLGFDVEVIDAAHHFHDAPHGLHWLTSGECLTFAECADRYGRVVLASTDSALVPAVNALRAHGCHVVVVTSGARAQAAPLTAVADEVISLASSHAPRR
jgi:hypothetical protein